MARKSKIEQYREQAPEIPTNTCPYIDFIQEIIKEIVDETDLVVDLQALARKKRKTMKNKKPPKK